MYEPCVKKLSFESCNAKSLKPTGHQKIEARARKLTGRAVVTMLILCCQPIFMRPDFAHSVALYYGKACYAG